MSLRSNRPVVLIVEDEFLLRMLALEMIEDAGFDVVDAVNADEAIAILEGRPDIHIVFTDIQMPGSMDGLKLAAFVRDRWPPIKIVATSGNYVRRDGDLPGRAHRRPADGDGRDQDPGRDGRVQQEARREDRRDPEHLRRSVRARSRGGPVTGRPRIDRLA